MKNFLLFQFFAFVIIASAFSQDAEVQFVKNNGDNIVRVTSEQYGAVDFDCGTWVPPREVIDCFMDDQFCVVVVKTPQDIYLFASAFKYENKWYVDHLFGSIFTMSEYSGTSQVQIVMQSVSIVNGELLDIQYDRTFWPLFQTSGPVPIFSQVSTSCEIRQIGLFDLGSQSYIFFNAPRYEHSPRK